MNTRQTITFALLTLSIIATAFCLEIGFYPFLQDTITDYRLAKETLALIFAAAIILWASIGGHKIQSKNPWICGLVFYICIHPILSPKFTIPLVGMNVGGFWEYKPIALALLYFFLFCVVSNLRWGFDYIKVFFSVLMWVGTISAGYVLLQFFQMDEFQALIDASFAVATHGNTLTGTFTQPNYSGSFIALMVPFAIYFRRWWHVAIMSIVVVLITSRMGMFILGIEFLTFCFFQWRQLTVSVTSLLLILGIIVWQIKYPQVTMNNFDSGRSHLWAQIIHDCTHTGIANKAHPILGNGLGFYHALWAPIHNQMLEAHNEWIQLWMDGGLVAVGLLIFSIFWLIKRLNICRLKDDQTVTLLACFVGILGGSCGLFLWQIEPHRLLTVIIFAMLHRKLNTEVLNETS